MAKSFSQSTLLRQNLKGWEDEGFIHHRGICPIKNLPFTHQLKHVSETLSTLSAHVSFLYGIALCSSPKRHLQELKSFVVSLEEKFLPTESSYCFFCKCFWPCRNRATLIISLPPPSFQGPHQESGPATELLQPPGSNLPHDPVRLQQSHHCQINSLNHTLRDCIKVPCASCLRTRRCTSPRQSDARGAADAVLSPQWVMGSAPSRLETGEWGQPPQYLPCAVHKSTPTAFSYYSLKWQSRYTFWTAVDGQKCLWSRGFHSGTKGKLHF